MSTYVSIGRNVGDQPLNATDWTEFISRTSMTVYEFAGPLVSYATGHGVYNDSPEDTFIVVGAQTPNPHDASCLRIALRALARAYGQECIALAICEPEFLTP